jgi:hypothetical protein
MIKKEINCDFWGKISPFVEVKIIKLTTSRPRHFGGHHL